MLRRFLHSAYDRPWFILIVTMALWGANGVASRMAVGRITPMSLVFLRWFVVCGLLTAFLWRDIARYRVDLWTYRRRIFLMAGVGFTGFTVLFYSAAYSTSAINMTLLQAALPPLVLAGAFLFRGVSILPRQILGMAITLIGVALVATRGEPWRLMSIELNRGDAMVLVGSVFYAGYTLALRDRPAIPPLVFFAALAFAAMVSAAPFLAIEIARGAFYWPTLAGWAVLVFVALGPSLASQVLFMHGVELIGPQRAGLFSNLTPIFGALFAVLLLGEDFHVYHAAALALTLAGVWIGEPRVST